MPDSPLPPQSNLQELGDKIDALASTLVEINNSNRKANDDKPETAHEKKMFRLELAGVIGLAVYCIFTAMEWRTFDSERKTMESEFRSAQTNATIENRAWVYIDRPGCSFDFAGKPNGISVGVLNSGRTPAHVKSIIVMIASNSIGLNGQIQFFSNNLAACDIAPGAAMKLECANSAIDCQGFGAYQEIQYYFSIIVDYEDIFGAQHCCKAYPRLDKNSTDAAKSHVAFPQWQPDVIQ